MFNSTSLRHSFGEESSVDNMTSFWTILLFSILPFVARGQDCTVSNPDKVDCGFSGTTQDSCETDGCCWQPIDPNPENYPWCYHTSDFEDPCDSFIWTAADSGFDETFYNIMYTNYLNQLNVENCGAVVAAPDDSTPGGSYYFHWMRDAGLSIKAWLDINNDDYETVKVEVDAYAKWVEMVQQKEDPNNIDVRIEPKFTIPDGEPYTGPWCRPQTDGPALRAMAMSKWGMILHNAGQGDPAHIWSLVQFDLDWVVNNWESEGCDLWEEVRSNNFYFNRMAYVYSLNVAADFGDLIGQSGGDAYRTLANTIKATAEAHWRPAEGYIYESENRPYDGAVIHSIATFGEHLFPPESEEAAATVLFLSKKFCREFPINQADNLAGKPGVLIGRYPGDQYDGGNPWQLLTAVTAEYFYLGGQATLKKMKDNGSFTLDAEKNKQWMKLLNLKPGTTSDKLAAAQIEAGDAVMTRLYEKVQNDGGRIDEQINENTGEQSSAQSLTWSYANILHALHVRKSAVQLRSEVLGF